MPVGNSGFQRCVLALMNSQHIENPRASHVMIRGTDTEIGQMSYMSRWRWSGDAPAIARVFYGRTVKMLLTSAL